MNIKLEQYKIFNEAASTLSFSIAARNLFISQSAVSQCIHTLEKELDTKLFLRQSKGVVLTQEGQMLHRQITEALSLINSAENELSHYKTLKKGELIIGAGDTLCKHYLLPYLSEYHRLYPDVHIKVINRTSIETIELLKSGQIDIGFVNLPIHEEVLEIKECFTTHDIFVSSKQEKHTYTYEELASKDLILLEASSNTRRYIDEIFSKAGILLKPRMELGAHELLLDFAKMNLGVACVIKEFSKEVLDQKELFEIKVTPEIKKRSIGYAYLKRRSLSVASLKFIELVESYNP